MRVDVRDAGQVGEGDLVAGEVNPTAPTRPVQPFAAAMPVRAVHSTPDGDGGRALTFEYGSGLTSRPYQVADQILVIVP